MVRAILTAALLLAVPTVAFSQPRQCGPRDNVLAVLSERYGETRQSIGLGASGQVMEVFASLDTGTWTILITSPAGLSCLVAHGGSFEPRTEEQEPTGQPL